MCCVVEQTLTGKLDHVTVAQPARIGILIGDRFAIDCENGRKLGEESSNNNMGFLTDGNTLNWSEVQKYCDYIRKHGIKQFLAIYEKTKNRSHDCLKFGDEIEYVLISLNDKEKKVKLSLRAAEILDELMREELEGHGYITPQSSMTILP